MKRILAVYNSPQPHWVGDGFPARTLFSYSSMREYLSPFLLLDYAGPAHFAPSTQRRGVGEHPHRGFETVTIVYQGEVEHRDSAGNGGRIGPGDVQWMTAASGIMHEEFHSADFSRSGGTLEMMQLWVNLPAKDKMAPPAYQTILNKDIPAVPLADSAGRVRVIAGNFGGHAGPARTFTPMNIWDVRVPAGKAATLSLPVGHSTALVLMHGSAVVNGTQAIAEAQLVVMDRSGDAFTIEAGTDATVLLLSGEPIQEPVVGYGPFVMNTQAEIAQAISDVQNGRFARLTNI
jgi:redox-sensitive bicupin YhaK (pirin superfamily)